MMMAIISDVHGNYPALKAVLEEIDKIGCDIILSLGDVAGYYCMINECINEFRNRGVINLMGNHDFYLLGLGCCPRSATVNKCIEYQKEIITKENIEYLKTSTLKYENSLLSARHGGWNNPIDEYIETFDFSVVSTIKKKFFCSGHTHKQLMQTHQGKTYFNPGSVGQPRDNNPFAGFALIDNSFSVKLFRVQYNIYEIVTNMKKAGFEDRISSCLYTGTHIKTFNVSDDK